LSAPVAFGNLLLWLLEAFGNPFMSALATFGKIGKMSPDRAISANTRH
jgi:hypothetical protein